MYEHEDLVDENFPKPANKPIPAHLAMMTEEEKKLPFIPYVGSIVPIMGSPGMSGEKKDKDKK